MDATKDNAQTRRGVMAFEDRRNRLSVPFTGGSPAIFSLNKGGKLLQGRLIITGDVVVSGVTAEGTLIGEGAPVGLVKRIQITATRAAGSRYPGGKIVDVHPRSLLRYAITQRGKFVADLFGQTMASGANGTYPVYLSIPIYFADPTNRNQVQTALNMDPVDSTGAPIYSNVQVQVDLASDLSGCFARNNGVVTFSGMQVQWDDDRLGLTGDTVPLVQEDHDMLIATTQTRAADYAMPQDGAFTSWLILAEASAARTLSSALLNRVTVTGPTINFDEYSNDIQQKMLDDAWFDADQSMTGQYFIDFTNGILLNSNPASGVAALFDVNNVSGANLDQLRIYTRRVYTLA
jgi:hypothetical protein